MNRLLPTPTPQDIEDTLTAIRNGESAIFAWGRAYVDEDDLWWVTSISPDGERHSGNGCGFTLVEATAHAWIGEFLPSELSGDLTEEDYAKVPVHVAEGWQFEVHALPVPALNVDDTLPRLRSALFFERKKSASDGEFLEHLHGLLREIIPDISVSLTYKSDWTGRT
jgi:hypothetical protein